MCASPRWESFGFLNVPLKYHFSEMELFFLTQQLPSLYILLLFCCCLKTLWARQLIGRTGFCLLLFLFLLTVPQGESMMVRRDGENAWNRKRWDHIFNSKPQSRGRTNCKWAKAVNSQSPLQGHASSIKAMPHKSAIASLNIITNWGPSVKHLSLEGTFLSLTHTPKHLVCVSWVKILTS